MNLKENLIKDYNAILNSNSPIELSKSLANTYEVLLKSPYKYATEEEKQITVIRHIFNITSYTKAEIDNTITDKESIPFETTYSGLFYFLKDL